MPIKTTAIAQGEQPPCRGFTLEVKVFIPKKDFRFHVIVDKTCVNNEGRFALTFELEKKIDGAFVQIVFVSFQPKPDDPKANEGIQQIAHNKLSQNQLQIAKAEVFPVAAELEGNPKPSADQKKRLEDAARKMAVTR